MSFEIGCFILLLCSTITGLVVEAIKKMVEITKPNIVAAIVSIIVGILIPIGYVLIMHISFSTETILYIVSIVVLSWLVSMLGYDKVIQSLLQVKRR